MPKNQEPPKENRLEKAAENKFKDTLSKALHATPEQLKELMTEHVDAIIKEVLESHNAKQENLQFVLPLSLSFKYKNGNFVLDSEVKIARQPVKFRHGIQEISTDPELPGME